MTKSQPLGFLATPTTSNGHGVLVLHAWWGLNSTIKSICNRLAEEEGYTAFAPDLYHGKVADTIPGAEALGSALDANYKQAFTEIVESAQFLHEKSGESKSGLAVIAFSLGGYYALQLADSEPNLISAVVLFYGAGGGDFGRTSVASYLGHFAENDPYENRADVDELEKTLRKAGRPVTFHHYKGTRHWFFEPDRVDAYNLKAAELAWERTLAFLKVNFED
jgi:carboxymethylenebutenolidase